MITTNASILFWPNTGAVIICNNDPIKTRLNFILPGQAGNIFASRSPLVLFLFLVEKQNQTTAKFHWNCATPSPSQRNLL